MRPRASATYGRAMRKLAVLAAFIVALLVPAAAQAAIPQVFTNTTSPVNCAVQPSGATAGQRWCGTATATVPSWDGVPIDVSVTFPAASGTDDNYPVIGIYHGWGGSKITPSNAATQHFVNLGYAVFSITDRGWGASCGGPPAGQFPLGNPTQKAAPCAKGYIHLMHNAFEVRDVQYLLGKLADQGGATGVIDPQRIGATGGSYGGGMALQLGALKDRVQLPDGSLIQWLSPSGRAMRIAGTAPEFGWTDLAQALMPNGSGLDYVADSPYLGVNGDHRFGIQKQNWNASLFNAGLALGYYAPISGAGYPDPQANLIQWNSANGTGGPYDGPLATQSVKDLATQQINELRNHGAYYTDDSEAPAPALISNGFNDDLFPVDEAIRYYNKIRADHPDAAIKMFHINFGHNPRAGGIAAADQAKLTAAEDAWLARYVKGTGPAVPDAQGGVDVITSICPSGAAGAQYSAPNWASLAPGEIRADGAAQQTIQAPGTAPSQAFTANGTTICTTQAAGDNASAATYKTDPIPAGGVTIAGSPTIIAELSTVGTNDMVAARLYDVDPADGQILLARGLYRPTDVGAGFAKQVFQLHPQAWKVPAGHVIKLELLSQDSTYARLATGRNSVNVRNLQLRLPTIDTPGSAAGLVQEPAAKYLPAGYELARDVRNVVPGVPHIGAADATPNATGVFSLAWNASQPAASLLYTLQHRDADDPIWSDIDTGLTSNAYTFTAAGAEGEGTWKYRVNAHEDDAGPATAFSGDSAAIKVDKTNPNAPTVSADRAADYAGDGGWFLDTVTVSITDNGDPALADGSAGSGVDVGSIPAPATIVTSGSHTTGATVKDAVGNESASSSLTVKVDADAPSLSVSCPAAVLLHGSASATVAASDGQSGLASDPSGTVAVDTSTVGPKTITRTATDNVGHTTTKSCTTAVHYMFSGLQQPVNPDGSSIFKLGSTVPLKFVLTDNGSNVVSGAVARVDMAKITNSVEGTFVEAISTSAATTGNLFRESGGQYIFNLSTKSLEAGTWSVKVTLDDGTSYSTQISLR